jgi:hypothetical protein
MKHPSLIVLASLTAAASAAFSQAPVPIVNHSFETPDVSAYGTYTYLGLFANSPNPAFVTGWTTVSTGSNGSIYSLRYGPSTLTNQSGSQFLEDFSYPGGSAAGGGEVYQDLTTSFVAGTTYELTAYAGPLINGSNGGETGDSFFIANSSGTVLASAPITGTTSGVLTQFTVPFVSTGLLGDTGTIRIGFSDPGQSAQSDMEIDNFALTAIAPVPEPSSIAIAALGGFGLLGSFVRRRRG